MFLHFYYINVKKENKNYFGVYKSLQNEITFTDINQLIFKNLNSNDINNDKSINYYELYYIKKGFHINYDKIIWNNLVQIFLSELNLLDLINKEYIMSLYNKEFILYNLDTYNITIKQFLINLYNN